MDPEKQRVAIAEACGWKRVVDNCGYYWEGHRVPPTYLNDLNAMHEAEELMIRSLSADLKYTDALRLIAAKANTHYTDTRAMVSATAAQRAEAFLRTLGKWQD